MSDDFEPDDIPEQQEAGIGDVASDVKDTYDDGKDIYNKGKEYAEKSRQKKSEQSQTSQKPTNRQPRVNGSGTSSSAGSQLNREAGRQVAQEGGKQAAKEGGKQVAKEAGKQVAKEAGKKAATTAVTTAASAAAGAASGGITILVELGVKAVKAVGNKVKDKLNNAGVDVDEGKKNAKRIGCLAFIGIQLVPLMVIILIIWLLVHEDSKTYDVSGTVDQFVECAEAVNGTCLDFMSTGFEVKGYGKRLIQFENGPWNPFVSDDVSDMTKQYVKFLKKYAVDDDAITFDFLNVGNIEEKVTAGEASDPDLALNTEQDKKTYNFKKKTMITYFRLSATSFNNIEWIMAGPKNEGEKFNIPVWDDESNLRVYGDRETYKGVLKSTGSLLSALALFAGRVKPVYMYNVKGGQFENITTKMDTNHVQERTYIDSDGTTKTRKVQTGLRVPEVDHIGITEEQYLQMLEPILPAWIEPMMVYSATGDWKLAERLYDFYQDALDQNPYKVGLYPIPTVTTVYIYEKHTAQTSEITGYEKMWDEDTSTYVDDPSRPIYKTVTYYGETTLSPDDIVDGEMYAISRTERTVKCSYTAVLLKGYTYDYNVDTKWSIKFGSSSMGGVVTNSDSKTVTQVDRYLIQSDGTEETPYKYTDVNGEETEVRNRLEWYIMTHYTESQLIWKKFEEKEAEATSDLEKKSVKGYEEIFKKEGVCKNDVVSTGCSDDEKIKSFDYNIDSLATVIQRCNEYYEKVKKDVSYSTSVSGVGSDALEYENYLNYSSISGDVFVWPATSADKISSCFGLYDPWNTGELRVHRGIDITKNNALGTVIVAARDGKVVDTFTGATVGDYNANGGYGNYVKIKHTGSDGTIMYSIYAHLSAVTVNIGDKVSTGDQIGAMGTTGNSTGVHLHFQIKDSSGNSIDPLLFLYGSPENVTCTGTSCRKGRAEGGYAGNEHVRNCTDIIKEEAPQKETIAYSGKISEKCKYLTWHEFESLEFNRKTKTVKVAVPGYGDNVPTVNPGVTGGTYSAATKLGSKYTKYYTKSGGDWKLTVGEEIPVVDTIAIASQYMEDRTATIGKKANKYGITFSQNEVDALAMHAYQTPNTNLINLAIAYKKGELNEEGLFKAWIYYYQLNGSTVGIYKRYLSEFTLFITGQYTITEPAVVGTTYKINFTSDTPVTDFLNGTTATRTQVNNIPNYFKKYIGNNARVLANPTKPKNDPFYIPLINKYK